MMMEAALKVLYYLTIALAVVILLFSFIVGKGIFWYDHARKECRDEYGHATRTGNIVSFQELYWKDPKSLNCCTYDLIENGIRKTCGSSSILDRIG